MVSCGIVYEGAYTFFTGANTWFPVVLFMNEHLYGG